MHTPGMTSRTRARLLLGSTLALLAFTWGCDRIRSPAPVGPAPTTPLARPIAGPSSSAPNGCLLTGPVSLVRSAGGRLYAGTQTGVSVSDDGGSSWSASSFGGGGCFLGPTLVAPAPGDPRTVYAECRGPSTAPPKYMLYLSRDSGHGFLQVGALTDDPDLDLWVSHTNPSVLWRITDHDNGYFERSADAGTSWVTLPDPGAVLSGISGGAFGVGADDTLYRAWALGGAVASIHRSTDGGTTWSVAADVPVPLDGTLLLADGGATVYAGGLEPCQLYRSRDSGAHFTLTAPLLAASTCASTRVTLDPANAKHLLVVARDAKTAHVLSTSDGGDTWQARTAAGEAEDAAIDSSGELVATSEGLYRLSRP